MLSPHHKLLWGLFLSPQGPHGIPLFAYKLAIKIWSLICGQWACMPPKSFWEWEKATFTVFPHFRKSPSLPLPQLHSFVLVEWWGQWCVISGDQRIGACDYRPDQTSAIGAQPHIGEKEVPYISSHVNLTSRTSQIGSRIINICFSHRNANLVQILFFWNEPQPAL